jgi:hypothetical protein
VKPDDSAAAYVAIQRTYTNMAFPVEPDPPSVRFAADSTLFTAPWKSRARNKDDHLDLVYPGARGFVIAPDSTQHIAAARVGDLFSRLMGGWAEQNRRLLDGAVPSDAAFVRRRDVRARVAALAPVLMQSRSIGVRETAAGTIWIVDLYSASDSYPLSAAQSIGDERLKYRHHAATVYVNGMTGAVALVPDSTIDPIAKTWLAQHSGKYISPSIPPKIAQAMLAQPLLHDTMPVSTPDSTLRARITAIYNRMRMALDSGNFHAFGDAFDSLGAAVGVR